MDEQRILRTVAMMLLMFAVCAWAQDAKAQSPSAEDKPQSPPAYVPPSVRLKEAKTAYVKNAGGSDIPFNVIQGGVEGWGRYLLVDTPDKADLIIEVNSPTEDSGVSVTSKTTTESGHTERSTKTTRELTVSQIKVTVYDGRNHVPLWSATERPKGGFKQKTREDNLVEAAQKLLRTFRERVEPETAK